MTKTDFDEFTRAYIDAALWSSVAYGSEEEETKDPADGRFAVHRQFQPKVSGGDSMNATERQAMYEVGVRQLIAQRDEQRNQAPRKVLHDGGARRNVETAAYLRRLWPLDPRD